MVRKNHTYPVKENQNMRGGDGVVTVESLLTPQELYQKGRLFARITLQPGCSIGSHLHEGEMESFYVAKGRAEFDDNGVPVAIEAGATTLTPSGQRHSVRNTGSEPVELIALILFA